MGSVRKASAWLGLVDDSGDERYYDEEYTDYAEETAPGGEPWVTDPRVRAVGGAAGDQGHQIATVTPDGFRDARAIGELFRDGIPVIINLTTMEPSDAKRVVDFAAGLIFGLRGSIDRIATRVFLLTPGDYRVLSARAAARGRDNFFNQS